ncbi:response regulator transcription factor [Domibacillus mangrovi]|uniref:Response regulator n=1 Tax=Domibacillus mangrovi TaxID=1714354 RepID=A0A1Q5NZS1_9BACI|nr:response regulator [Domibacillus mangrovi]OKL35507.1 response regulator [Domibacillus mangrovi]
MKKILIADDEDILRMLIEDTLEDSDLGFEIDEAEDGREALDKILNGSYDLVILDYMMPHLTGMEVLEQLRLSSFYIPVLMLTAKAQETDRERALQNGAEYFMSKPFSPIELLNLVESILETS